jgi:hypothetical protein
VNITGRRLQNADGPRVKTRWRLLVDSTLIQPAMKEADANAACGERRSCSGGLQRIFAFHQFADFLQRLVARAAGNVRDDASPKTPRQCFL